MFFGLINVEGNPFVIEYNVRMGDPETEAVMLRVKSDFVDLLKGSATGTLNEKNIEIDDQTAVTVMLVSGGYPGNYEKGKVISGADKPQNSIFFHAGNLIQKRRNNTIRKKILQKRFGFRPLKNDTKDIKIEPAV